ncbi:putative ATP-grasp-modified RiPP [Streptacidiphilus sp. EB129]|uniref:putative ATP-grasp-modified RiPP n=1 Tax=Streptacidiphilus sp. EB129 TaxID=3156262 RepID=UPI003519B173
MLALTDRVPTLNLEVSQEPSGPEATRPFGLTVLTPLVRVGPRPTVTVDPDTQLSVLDGLTVIDDLPTAMANSSCNTESDGKDAIAIDSDANDD